MWLNELVTFMRDTLRGCLVTALEEAGVGHGAPARGVGRLPFAVALITSQIVWDEGQTALDDWRTGLTTRSNTSRLQREARRPHQAGPGRPVEGARNKIITLITIDVHSRDIVGALITKRVENAQDFLWSSQLRYYWAADSRDADIRICDYRSVYSFEYVGNCGRLVITPLTDRCYVTLTTAIDYS